MDLVDSVGEIAPARLVIPDIPGGLVPIYERQSASAEKCFTLFENLPTSYNPSTCWLDGCFPAHPHFNNADEIQYHVKSVKQPLFRYILEGCQILLTRTNETELSKSFSQHETLWRAGVSIEKYGVIYLATRSECRNEFLPAISTHQRLFQQIEEYLRANANAIRAINYGVHRLVNSGTLTVEYQQRLVPPFAISAIGPKHVAVREQDFQGDSACLLDIPRNIWDFHDFAHQTAASLCPELYGSKYWPHLIKLPVELTALIRSPRMKTANPTPRFSDGVIFSELLTPLFTVEVEANSQHTYKSLTDIMATYVSEYLMGQRGLQHLSTGCMLRAEQPIDAVNLAVLVQNKSYELTASEIEQRVMTRGGPSGNEQDELDGMSSTERIRFLADCRRWLYFEARNTIKHRAQKLAYAKTAEKLLSNCSELTEDGTRHLLDCILDNVHYVGWQTGKVPNLWETVRNIGLAGT